MANVHLTIGTYKNLVFEGNDPAFVELFFSSMAEYVLNKNSNEQILHSSSALNFWSGIFLTW